MSTENKVVYVPSTFVKTRQTNFGEVIQLDITDVKAFGEFVKANKKENNSISFELVPRKDPSKNSHSFKLNTWVPKAQTEGEAPPVKKAVPKKPAAEVEPDGDLPF